MVGAIIEQNPSLRLAFFSHKIKFSFLSLKLKKIRYIHTALDMYIYIVRPV